MYIPLSMVEGYSRAATFVAESVVDKDHGPKTVVREVVLADGEYVPVGKKTGKGVKNPITMK